MRTQLAAADVTCRAPGCEHHAGGCQVDHVIEHATAGGTTKESNGQLVDTWHHDPKTARAWDAVLHANRDVTWTTTLSRIYRTRVHDYRELVTLIVDALDRVATAREEDVADQINTEVYQALCYRDRGERLNEGDDDTYDETHLARFGGDITITLSHRDPRTGRRAPGASPAGQARAHATAATTRTTPPHSDNDTSPEEPGNDNPPRYPGGNRWHLTDRSPGRTTDTDRPDPRRTRPRHRPRQTPWSTRLHDDPPF